MNKIFSAILFFFLFAAPLWAQEVSYDRYGTLWPEGHSKENPPQSAETFGAWGRHFLVYPFELIRWPADKTLLFIEDHHIDDKAQWIYNQMKDRGFTPRFIKGASLRDSFGGGFDLELMQLLGLKARLPDFSLKYSNFWTFDEISHYEAEVVQKIPGTGLSIGGVAKYEKRGDEHFYGIGPNTSLGDGSSYQMERTTLESNVGYEFLNTWGLKGKFAFQNVNITNDSDGGRGIIDEIFVRTGRQQIPGLAGDKILNWALELQHDNRDDKDVPTEGGYERVHFSYNKGIEGATGYFKYRGEAAHFFKLFSPRRVLAFHGVAEHNDELGDRSVPFFDSARLGGYGPTRPRIGDTQRGYRRDRFYDDSLLLFNAEYRWTAWEYRDLRMDPAFFCDVGQVFGEWSRFQFDDFRIAYGLAFRVSLEKNIVLTFEIAKSNEGVEFYASTHAPF